MPGVRGPSFAMGGTWRLNSEVATIRADAVDHGRIEPHRRQLVVAATLVDHPVEEPVQHGVAEARLGLVGLAGPQVRRRRLADDRLGNADRRRQLAHLALVQVADRVEGAGAVAEERRVADQRLGLVAGPDHEAAPRHGAIVEDEHPGPRHRVPAPQGGRLERIGAARARHPARPEVPVDDRRDLHQLARAAQPLDHLLGVRPRRRRRRPVRQAGRTGGGPARSPRRPGTPPAPNRSRPRGPAPPARSRPGGAAHG